MVRAVCLAVALWSSTLQLARAQDEPALRPTLAIVDFETRPAGTILPPPGLGSALAELMLTCLVQSGKYRVLDGRWVAPRPEDFEDAAQMHTIRRHLAESGVDYVVIGSMQRFSVEDRRRAYGGGVIIPLIGGLRRNKLELAVAITVRVVDVRSGEIATIATSQGTANRNNVAAGVLGFFNHGGGGGFSKSSSGSRDAMLDEAIRRAVVTAAQGVINAADKLKGKEAGL
jgi:curli biogenesis system outer membrane secretion channel CsgG